MIPYEYKKQWVEKNKKRVQRLQRKWYLKNKEKVKLAANESYLRNKEKVLTRHKNNYINNPSKILEGNKRCMQNNPGAKNYYEMKRRAARLKQTPKWLTKDHIKEMKTIYDTCPKGFHVDHIIPLNGREVRGLHVPWNLQHLPAAQNCSKGNKI